MESHEKCKALGILSSQENLGQGKDLPQRAVDSK